MVKRIFATLIALASLSASNVAYAEKTQITEEKIMEIAENADFRRVELEPKVRRWTDEEMRTALIDAVKNQTKIIYQDGHGVYIEYTAPDGRLFMWYPGNNKVVYGEWGVQKVKNKPLMCFKYFNSYHGVTGEFEPEECINQMQILSQSSVLDLWEGDAFNLASGKLPYKKSKTDIPDWPTDKSAPSDAVGN